MNLYYCLWFMAFCTLLPHNGITEETTLAKSLEPFSIATNSFLNTIQPDSGIYIVMSNLFQDGKIKEMNSENGLDIFRKTAGGPYVGLVILFLIGFLFFITMPFIGLFFCCCRCCCEKCGGNVSIRDKKKSRCLRITYALLLFFCSTIMLLGGVLACLSNKVLHDDLSSDENSLLIKGIKGTISQGNQFLGEFLSKFDRIVNETIGVHLVTSVRNLVENEIYDQINPTIFQIANLHSIIATSKYLVSNFSVFEKEVIKTASVAKDHLSNASVFEEKLNDLVNRTVVYLDNNCPSGSTALCTNLKSDLNENAKMNFNYSKIDYDVPELLVRIFAPISASSIDNDLKDLENRLNSIGESVRNQTKSDYEKAMNKISNTSEYNKHFDSLDDVIRDLQKQLKNFESDFMNATVPLLSDKTIKDGAMQEADIYRYYFEYAFAGFMLFLVLLIYIGLLFGVIGSRPYEDASCCNKGVAANFFMAFIGFAFIFTWILMLILMLMFFLGVSSHNEGCRPLTSSDTKYAMQLNDAVNYVVDINGGSSTIPKNITSALLIGCRNNRSIINEMNLDKNFNVEQLFNSTIEPFLKDMKESISGATSFDASTSELTDNLENLQTAINNATKLNDRMEASNVELSKYPIKAANVSSLIEKYEAIVKDSQSQPFSDQIVLLKDEMFTLVNTMRSLQMKFKSQYTTLNDTLPVIQGLVNNVAPQIRDVGNTLKAVIFEKVVDAIIKTFSTKLRDLIDETIYGIFEDLGNCYVVHNILLTFDNTFCKILDHYNLFWSGIGICYLFLIPSMIFAGKLVSLYRKTEAYTTTHSDSADYLANQQFYPHTNGMPLDKEYFLQRRQNKPFSDIS